MADPYANVNDLKDQGRKLTLITPSDSVDIPNIYKALLIGGTAGNIAITAADGNFDAAGVVTATSNVIPVTAGQTFDPVRVKRLWATGTTASPVYGIS
jgi:hypothetical protein